jgi:hypothetical protein
MRSFMTSFDRLFSTSAPDLPAVHRIEVPLIQRDYAQGRDEPSVRRIRDNFLDALHRALAGPQTVCLDFVFGDVDAGGTLRPLDGQQRLTTLFLLHWYLACRTGHLAEERGWKNFTYATRPSARLFCERLVKSPLPAGDGLPSEWLRDQHWFLHTWNHDPTIQGMLVMLDAIHGRFEGGQWAAPWERLVHPDHPAITFHLLPVDKLGLSDDLYIKMNSRGKPLTPFENFKARFEQVLAVSCPERLHDFSRKVDCDWTDMLWPYHGGDFIVDQEFMHYLHFVTEVCEWREGRFITDPFDIVRAERTFGAGNPRAKENVDFLSRAFDTWVGKDIAGFFATVFAAERSAGNEQDASKVVLFSASKDTGVNLFDACCRHYGEMRGERNRTFTLQNTLLLYAAIVHRHGQTLDFPRRLRVVRNLVEASSSEIRVEKMTALLADVDRVVIAGSLDEVTTFNQAQVADERLKAALLSEHSNLELPLFALEDHPTLRGCVAAFELDATVFTGRSDAFVRLFSDSQCWPELTGALLAAGHYYRRLSSRQILFGSSSNGAPWRELLSGTGRTAMEKTREALGQVLDAVGRNPSDTLGPLQALQQRWLASQVDKQCLGWRYYFVKYPCMRTGSSGRYAVQNGKMGFSVCMLHRLRMSSPYWDPFVQAVVQESGLGRAVDDPRFTGYVPRWLRLKRSSCGIRCVEAGWEVSPPLAAKDEEAFLKVCTEHGIGPDRILLIPFVETDEGRADTQDRVQVGAAVLSDLVAAGL